MKDLLDPTKPVVPVAYPRLLMELVLERGFSRAQLLEGVALAPAVLDQADTRLTPPQFAHLITNALYLTKEPALGYELGLREQITAHGFLGYAVMSCATLREAIQLGERFIRLRTIMISLSLREEGDAAVVEVVENYPFGPLRQFAFDSLMVSLARAGNFITGESFAAGEIWFDYPEPSYYAAYRDRLPPMRFDRGATQLRFRRELLDRPLVMADSVAARLAVDQCERELALVGDAEDILLRIRAALAQHQSGYPDLATVAARLNLSERTLKRRLQQHGTSYQQLLDDVRKREAIRLLTYPGLALEQIARELGYTDPANFTRAFRKWTGEVPSSYRQRLFASG